MYDRTNDRRQALRQMGSFSARVALATLPLAVPFAATGSDIAWLALLGLVQ